jgi:hypothetical protein
MPTSREHFCKGLTDRKRCANGAFFARESLRPAKLVVVNQIAKVKSRAQARPTSGVACQVPIVCILLPC